MGARSTSMEPASLGGFSPLAVGLLGLGAVAIKSVGGVVAAYGQARFGGKVGSALRLEVLGHWLGVHRLRPARQFDHGCATPRPNGDAAARPGPHVDAGPTAKGVAALTMGVREVEAGLSLGVLGGLRAVAQIVPLLVLLVWIAPRMAGVALVVFLPFSIAMSTTRRRWKRAHARAAQRGEALLEAADEAVRHADLWTTYGAGGKARQTVASLGHALALQSARLEASAAALSGANEVLGAFALVCALGAARAGWLGDTGGNGALLSFAVAFFLAYRPLRDLTDARLALVRATSAFDELRALTGGVSDASGADAEVSNGAREPDAEVDERHAWPLAALELRDLVLSRGSLAPLSLSLGAGQIVALVAPTGMGKTTLLRTLLGLESPVAGEIRYDGASLGTSPPGLAARPFAWVPQDAPLLADTLAANLSLGCEVDPRVALAPLGATHLVESLGSERLGAGGRAVSGGERQWIALARAIATRQPILLLDEPTSGLDARSQSIVLSAIARLRGTRSILMVTHREEPLSIADAVVRLEAAPVGQPASDQPASERRRNGGPAVTRTESARSVSPSST